MLTVRQKVSLCRILINQLVVLLYLKEFNFHLSSSLFYPFWPQSDSRLSQNKLFSDPLCWCLSTLLTAPCSFSLCLVCWELLWTHIAPGTISITPPKTGKREELLSASSVVLLNTNVCFPVSANITLDSVSEGKMGLLELWLCWFCNRITNKKI